MRQRQEAALAALNQRRMLRIQEAIHEYGELYPKFLEAVDDIAIQAKLAELVKLIPAEEVLRINAQANLVMQQQVVAEKLRIAIDQSGSVDEKNALAGRLAQAEAMVKSLQQDLENTIQANGVAAERQRLQYETDLRVAQDKVAARDRDLLAAQGDVARLQGIIDNLNLQQAQEVNDAVRAAKAAEAATYRDELARVQNKIRTLQEEKDKQARELQSYKEKVAEQKALIESINAEAAAKDRRMEARVTALEDAKREALAKLTAAEKAKEKAEEELGTQKSAFETLQEEHDRTTIELSTLQASKTSVENELTALRERSAREATNLTEQINAKDTELREIRTQLSNKTTEWQQSQGEVKRLGDRVKELEADRAKQLAAYQTAKTDLETKLSAAESKVATLTSQLATAGVKRTELEGKITAAEKERDTANAARDEAIANLTTLQTQHGKTTAELEAAKAARDKANDDYNAAKGKLTTLQQEKDTLQQQYDDLKKSTDEARAKLEKEVQDKSTQIAKLTALNNDQKTTIKNLQKNEEQFKNQITQLDTQLSDKTKALSAAEAARNALQGERDAKQLEIEQISQEKKDLEDNLSQLTRDLAAEKANVTQNVTRIQELEAQVGAKTQELVTQGLKLSAAEAENSRLGLLVQQQGQQIEALKKERDEKATQLLQSQNRVTTLEQNIVTLKSEQTAALLAKDQAMQSLKDQQANELVAVNRQHEQELNRLKVEETAERNRLKEAQAAEISRLNAAHTEALNAAARERNALIDAHNLAMGNLRKELDAANLLIKDLRLENQRLLDQIDLLTKRYAEQKVALDTANRLYDAELRQNNQLREANTKLGEEVGRLRADNAAKAGEITRLTGDLTAANLKNQALETAKNNAEKQVADLKTKLAAAGTENLTLKKQVDRLEAEKAQTQQQHEEELRGLRTAHEQEIKEKDKEVTKNKEEYERLAKILNAAKDQLNQKRSKNPVLNFDGIVEGIEKLQAQQTYFALQNVKAIHDMNFNMYKQMYLVQTGDMLAHDKKWKEIDSRRSYLHSKTEHILRTGKLTGAEYEELVKDSKALEEDFDYVRITVAKKLDEQKQTIETVQAKQLATRTQMKKEQDKFTAFTNKLYKIEHQFLPPKLKEATKPTAKAMKALYESGKSEYQGKFTGTAEWKKIASRMKNLQDLALSEDEYRDELQKIYSDEVLPFITAELIECQTAMGGKQAFRGEAAPVTAAGAVAGMRKQKKK